MGNAQRRCTMHDGTHMHNAGRTCRAEARAAAPATPTSARIWLSRLLVGDSGRDIQERAFKFACGVIKFCDTADDRRRTTEHLLLQLFAAGTSIGANLAEASAGQTKPDFIAKTCVSLKEAREARYWLLPHSCYSRRAAACRATAARRSPSAREDPDNDREERPFESRPRVDAAARRYTASCCGFVRRVVAFCIVHSALLCIVHCALCIVHCAFAQPVLTPLHPHRHPQAPADAERGQAAAGVAAVHLVEQGDEDARARAADRVAERDRAAVDVQPIARDRQIREHREHLRRRTPRSARRDRNRRA